MAFIDRGTEHVGAAELPPSSAQSRENNLGVEAVHMYTPPLPKGEISEHDTEVRIGCLVTICTDKTKREFKIYISDETRDIAELAPLIQEKLADEKAIINPFNDLPTHKQMNLAQFLHGKRAGDTIILHNGERARITVVVDLNASD